MGSDRVSQMGKGAEHAHKACWVSHLRVMSIILRKVRTTDTRSQNWKGHAMGSMNTFFFICLLSCDHLSHWAYSILFLASHLPIIFSYLTYNNPSPQSR